MDPTAEQAKRVVEQVKQSLMKTDDKVTSATPFLTVATATRYLRGYKDEAKAARNMLHTYRYRRLLHVDDLGTSEETFRTVWTELGKRSLFLGALSDEAQPPSPVLILRKRGEAFEKQDFEEYRRAFFFTLDVAARLADKQLGYEDGVSRQKGQWVIVMDMLGYSSKNSPPLNVSMETLRIFQNHFPERAKRIIVLDAPRTFSILWTVLRPLIDPVTRNKFIFTSRSIGDDALRQLVGNTVYECINMELEKGKEMSAKFMMDNGFLRAKA